MKSVNKGFDMKQFLLLTTMILTSQAGFAVLSAQEPGGHCLEAYTHDTKEACRIMFSTTSLPTVLLQSESSMEMDEMILQFADEVSGLATSNQASKKLAEYFDVSLEELTDAGVMLLNSEQGLSFETLKEAVQ